MAPNSKSKGDDGPSRAKAKSAPTTTATVTLMNHRQQQNEMLRQYENERDQQRQKMEELGRRKLEIDTAMTKLTRTLEQLDQNIERIEIELLNSNNSSNSRSSASNTVPQPIIKTEANIMIKSEKEVPASSTTDTLFNLKQDPRPRRGCTKADEKGAPGDNDGTLETTLPVLPPPPLGTKNNNESMNQEQRNVNNCPNPYSRSMTMTTQQGDHEILTDPHGPPMTLTMVPQNEYLTEPNDNDDDDFQLYDDDDDDEVDYHHNEQDENDYVNAYVQQQQPSKMPINLSTASRTVQTLTSTESRTDSQTSSVLITHTVRPTQPEVFHKNNTTHCDNNSRSNHHVITPHNNEDIIDTYPWSTTIHNLLQTAFRIPSFREQQLDIINTTMRGMDTFVIMRTGGGKSLTYQLPALYEGRFNNNSSINGNHKKITLVISPLLSLIQDQEEQMNLFAPGSAISFTSSIGVAEHTRRWNQVRDPTGGICIIFCTPEKVSKSNRLCSELDKLHAQNRLGRFVIDEAHCACQWGHDFRPDYAKLGKLKSHFPTIPIIAVTATASDRVRDDVCEILRIRHDYQFFRSTFHRPNLIYSIIPKPDNKDSTIEIMANFIKTKYPNDAGIVYTYSRKDADNVADALCNLGVIAEPYHSDVNASTKEAVHKSWMRNETQVVVATIAFGLGINKPDVRFVLHHSISKTLEAYYQESGRAGRDGNPSECVLYYNPKDVVRLLKMVHGTSSENLLWPMVRYAQQSGNDPICKAVLLTHLGEPNAPDVMKVVSENEGVVTQKRDLGKHAKTVVELLHIRVLQDENVTMAMLVKDWRSTGAGAEQCVKDNPPKKDGLSQDDCERVITSLLLEKVISTNPKWNAYDTVIYLVLGEFGPNMLSSLNPRFVVQLPTRDDTKAAVSLSTKAATTKAAKQSNLRKTLTKDGDWLSTKSAPVKRKKAATAHSKPAKKVRVKSAKKATPKVAVKAKPTKVRTKKVNSAEVIELSSDDDDTEVDVPLVSLKQVDTKEVLWDDDDDDTGSEDEYEFEE